MSNSMSRVTRSKVDARKNYNRLSRWYDLMAKSEEKYRKIGVEMLECQPGEKILEIGFGTGQVLVELAKMTGSTRSVFGIELSDGMISVSQQKIEDAGVSDRVRMAIADAAKIPFSENHFDSIFMSFFLELVDTPEIPGVLAQCRRVLSPGGRLIIVTLAKSVKPNFAENIYEWFHAKMPVVVDCRPIYARQELNRAGFEIAQVRSEKMWGLPVEIISART